MKKEGGAKFVLLKFISQVWNKKFKKIKKGEDKMTAGKFWLMVCVLLTIIGSVALFCLVSLNAKVDTVSQNLYIIKCNIALNNTNQVYFISNEAELNKVKKLVNENNLHGAIAIFQPFYRKEANTIDLLVAYCKEHYCPVLMYCLAEKFDHEIGRKVLGWEIRHEHKSNRRWAACAGSLWLESAGQEPNIFACINSDENDTEISARRFVHNALEGFGRSVKNEIKATNNKK